VRIVLHRKLKKAVSGLALVTLGFFGLQTISLPIHEATHRASRAHGSEQSHVHDDVHACGLCLTYHSNSADTGLAPALDFVSIFIPLLRGVPFLELPVLYSPSPEARGPPAA
jgi:hypothetical protein